MNRKVDDIIKKKLENYDSKYPDHMWESIAKKLPEKKRKPYYIWFFVIFLALLSYSLTYYSFNKLSKENKENKIPISSNTKTSVTINQKGGNINTVNGETDGVLSGNHTNGNEFQNELNTADGTVNGNLVNTHSSISGIQEKRFKTKHTTSNASNVPSMSLHSDNDASEVLKSSNQISLIKDENDANNKGEKSVFSANLDEDKRLAADMTVTDLSARRSQQVLSALATLTLDNQLSELAKKHAALACPTFVKKQNTNTLEFYFSNDFAKRNLEIKRGDGLNYLNQRTQTEVAHLSNSFGFRLGMGWESGIAFKTGLNYTSINEKFIYTDPNSIQKKTITVVKYKYDDDLNIVDSTVTQEIVEIPGTNTIVSKNRYSFIDIPILFQYSIQGKKRLSYDVTAGPFINLLVSQSGKILDDSGKKIVSLDDDEGSKLFKNNVGVSFYGSVAINYQLTKQMKISLEPNVRYMPSSITSYTNNLDQKYLIAGIAAGVKIRI